MPRYAIQRSAGSNMKKKRIVTILIVIATLALAGVAVFTAIRLYQLRQEPVAPTAPTSQPQAATTAESCTALAFTLTTPTDSPTATPSGSPTATPTTTATATATAEPALPDAGVSYPTIVGGAAGILLILLSLVLAL